jgi:hypothetical protein
METILQSVGSNEWARFEAAHHPPCQSTKISQLQHNCEAKLVSFLYLRRITLVDARQSLRLLCAVTDYSVFCTSTADIANLGLSVLFIQAFTKAALGLSYRMAYAQYPNGL